MPDLPPGDDLPRRTCTSDDDCPDFRACRMSLPERSRVVGVLGAEAVEVRRFAHHLTAFEGVTVPHTFHGADVYRLAHRDTGSSWGSAPCAEARRRAVRSRATAQARRRIRRALPQSG